MGFLTLEDVNSANMNYINGYYVLDTSKISLNEFENVAYDFCIVSHSISGNNHIFKFKVYNSLWCGGYYVYKIIDPDTGNPRTINVTGTYDSSANEITITTTHSDIKLALYLCSFAPSFNFRSLRWCSLKGDTDPLIVSLNEIGTTKPITFIKEGDDYSENVTLNLGVIEFNYRMEFIGYLHCILKKSDLVYDLTETDLTVGVVNRVCLNVDSHYLPDGDLTDDNPLDIVVKYDDLEIPVAYDETLNDYCFDLDLSDKADNKPVTLEVIVYESKYVNPATDKIKVNCNYPTVDSFNAFKSLIIQGMQLIELASDIVFTEDLRLPQSLYLVGDGFNIDMGNHTLFISGVNFRADNTRFSNGSPVFVQGGNSKLILNGCRFTNASISDEYKGSVLSILNGSNIQSKLKDCFILNCHHSIYHSGELILENIKALYNNFNSFIDTDYPALLTQYDGTVNITNSTFDIDYNTDNICTSQTDIKYAESLVAVGEDTVINGLTTDKLTADDTLPLFEFPYNNRSHIYCKYYYPAVETCVVSSPLRHKEDKSVCHNILGTDWVFKNNVQVTRADSNKQNTYRKIIWEDI